MSEPIDLDKVPAHPSQASDPYERATPKQVAMIYGRFCQAKLFGARAMLEFLEFEMDLKLDKLESIPKTSVNDILEAIEEHARGRT